MAPPAHAFALLTLPDVVLSTPDGRQRGVLVVECVTLDAAPAPARTRPVVFVLRVNELETAVACVSESIVAKIQGCGT
jgi:hypothetical protein